MTTAAPPRIAAGTPALRRIQASMVCAGLAAFALLYATQALLPDIGKSFGVGATAAVLAVGGCFVVGGAIAAGVRERGPDARPAR